MNPIFLHTNAVMSFVMVLITSGMFLYVVRLPNKTRLRKLMAVYYAFQVAWFSGDMVRGSLHPALTGSLFYQCQVSFWFAPALSGVLIIFTQICYLFLEDIFPRERRLVFKISIVFFAGFVGHNIWNQFFNNSDEDTMHAAGFLSGFLWNSWQLLVCLRKARKLKEANPWAAKGHVYLSTVIGVGFVLPCITSLAFGVYSYPGFWTYFVLIWLGNIAEITVYITYSILPANFKVKVVGFTFLTVATVLLLVTLMFFPPLIPSALEPRLLQQEGLQKIFFLFIGSALIVVLVLPRILRASLISPLQRLVKGVEQVNAGDLTTQVRVGSPDEIGELTRNFNQMTLSLKKAYQDLTLYAENLEEQVVARTTEIEAQRDFLKKAYDELKSTQAQLIQAEMTAALGELERKLADTEMVALRAQMNPHFIFNCLNSIKLYTLQNNSEQASDYLSKFARLIRLVLENSRSELVPLKNELEALQLYSDLEAMRFKHKVKCTIQVSPSVDTQYLQIPPLLVQPYVENAIWHGLMHKQEGGTVKIQVHQSTEHLLRIEITDDGVGRAKAAQLKSKSTGKHKSFGLQVTADRIRMINYLYDTNTQVHIHDLVDSFGEPCGTKVVLEIPVS